MFPTWLPLKKSHPHKHELSQEHVLLNSHLSSASKSGALFQGYVHFRQGSRQVGCPHRPCGFHPPLTAGRKLMALMWLAHRLTAPRPQEVDQVDFWEICLLSLTVFVLLADSQNAKAHGELPSGWLASRVLRGTCLPKPREAHFLPQWAVLLASHLLCPPCITTLCAASSGSPLKWELSHWKMGRFYSPKLKSEQYLQFHKFSNFFFLKQQGYEGIF